MTNPLADRLPLNRKERFYTGTVLPMIVCCDEFAYFGRFLNLCGVPDVTVVADPASTNVQFFTEYGFKESLVDGAESRFQDPGGKDTPDVVAYIESTPSVLLGIEAKVFSKPSRSKIKQQVQVQAELLSVMRDGIPTQPEIFQVALLPSGLTARLGASERIAHARVLTWELVADTFRDVAPAYWISVLDEALERYAGLVSQVNAGGQNNDGRRLGELIKSRWEEGDREFLTMGRQSGLDGKLLKDDLETGQWRDWAYEVSRNPLPSNPNWFPIESFLSELSKGSRPQAGSSNAASSSRTLEPSKQPIREPPRRPTPTTKPVPWKGGGKNADDKISGQAIYSRYTAGDTNFTWMGRTGGRQGFELLEDLRTGRWKTQKYEVRHDPLRNNRNWFPIKSFVEGINLRKPDR